MKETSIIENADPSGAHTLEIISKTGKFNKWMYDTIKPYLKGSILEIGSGIGNISQFAIKNNKEITLSDINPVYQELLNKKFAGVSNVKDVLSIDLQHPAFSTQYKYLEEKYDTVFLLNVIEHLENDRAAVDNCRFLLKPGGHLVILTPSYSWLYCRLDRELGHYRRYTIKKLSTLVVSSSFTLVHAWYFNFAGIAGWGLFGKIFGNKLIGQREMQVYDKLVPIFKFIDRIMFNKVGLSVIVTAIKNQ